jgi:hypothetical protein
MKTLIAAALLLALTSPAHAEWFLIFDIQLQSCSTRSHCVDDGASDFVTKETFATRKQCLAEGHRIIKLFNARQTVDILDDMFNLYVDAEGSGVSRLHTRCEEGFEMSGTAAEWDCDNDITALANRGRFYIEMGRLHAADTYPDRGSWAFRKNGGLWINGRQCKQTN